MKKYFLTGLATLLPVALTFWIVSFLVNLLTNPFNGWVIQFMFDHPSLEIPNSLTKTISQVSILFILLILTLLIGAVARRFFFKQLLQFGDHLVQKIPLINKIYKTSKEMVLSLFNTSKQSFQKVVLFPFPNKESYCLGLIASDAPQSCKDTLNDQVVSIFIPTTPNPTSGYLVLVEKKDLIHLTMKPDEAIKYVMSCGIVQPDYQGNAK